MNRRNFLKLLGGSAVAAVVAPALPAPDPFIMGRIESFRFIVTNDLTRPTREELKRIIRKLRDNQELCSFVPITVYEKQTRSMSI
jgi:hypothetical protein